MPVLPTVGLNYDYLAATKDVWSAFAQAKDFWHEKRSFEAKPNIQLSTSLDANGDLMDDSKADVPDRHFLPSDSVTQCGKSYKDSIYNCLSEQ
ncbi:hypothetical protein LTS15_000676 [Exophiala xenobiotica]|nr:hypothetical protein LTS15_000676 [Exophiala xenobiotica]